MTLFQKLLNAIRRAARGPRRPVPPMIDGSTSRTSLRRYGVPNGSDDTTLISAALASGAIAVEIPYQSGVPWHTQPITWTTKRRLMMQDGAHLKASSSGYSAADKNLIKGNLLDQAQFMGFDSILEMRREALSVDADGPHCLNLRGCTNTSIEGLVLKNGSGDGLYIGPDTTGDRTPCQDIRINRLLCDNNRRQGISITAGRRITVKDCILKNTNGASPQAGIDVEPNAPEDPLVDIIIRNCLAQNNSGDGFTAPLSRLTTSTEAVSILFDQCNVRTGGTHGLSVSNTGLTDEGPAGTVEFRDCTVQGTAGSGIRPIWDTGWAMTVKFTRCIIRDVATALGSQQPIRMTLACDTVPAGDGGIVFEDCVIYDQYNRALVTAVVTGLQTPRVSGNICIINPNRTAGALVISELPDLNITIYNS